jgi:hypothetical protein
MAGPRKTFIHPGKFELMRERFQLDWLRPPPPQRMRKVAEMLPGVMREMGLENTDPLTRLRRAWPELVGPELARRARPGALNRGTLVLYVDNPTDVMELRTRLPVLLDKARLALSQAEVRQARLMIDPAA